MLNDATVADLAEPAAALAPDAAVQAHTGAAATVRTVLCVDDEPNILSALRRLFRSSGYRIVLAGDGPQALDVLAREHVDLIISDMRMPGMDGSQLLEQVRQRWPAITRVLLTGYADVKSTIAAINRGEIYRYVNKPWNDDEMLLMVQQVFERHALQDEKRRLEELTLRQNDELKTLNASLEAKVAARTEELAGTTERLKKNYLNSIKVVSNLIELRGGALNGHARRVADLARRTALQLGLGAVDAHEVFIAGLLHDIGHIGLPEPLLATSVPLLSAEDKLAYAKHATLGELALMPLDDMRGVAALVRSHHERPDGHGYPDGLAGDAIPMGARILAVVDTHDDLQSGHLIRTPLTADEARTLLLRGKGSQFDGAVVDAFLLAIAPARRETGPPCIQLAVEALLPGMVLGRELRSAEGVMLLAADQILTADLLLRIRALARRSAEPLLLSIRSDRLPT